MVGCESCAILTGERDRARGTAASLWDGIETDGQVTVAAAVERAARWAHQMHKNGDGPAWEDLPPAARAPYEEVVEPIVRAALTNPA